MTDEEKRIVEWLDKERAELMLVGERRGARALGTAILCIERGDHMKGINNG